MNEEQPTASCPNCKALEAQVAELRTKIERLEERLRGNSSNSSRPPSTDQPGSRPVRSRDRAATQRSRKGRGGHQRVLLEPERITETISCLPSSCSCCGESLDGLDPQPLRHQTIELPPIEPLVTEYQLHKLTCRACGHNTTAQLPPQAQHTFGPRLVAFITLMVGHYHLSRRQTLGLLGSVMNIDLSLGSLHKHTLEASEAVADAVEEVAQAVKQQPVVHSDETGWKRQRGYRVLWTATTSLLAYFRIQTQRSKAAAQAMLGLIGEDQVIVSDRYSSYKWLKDKNRQVCWAHLDRDFLAMSQAREALARETGDALLALADEVFCGVSQQRGGHCSWAVFAESMGKIRERVQEVAQKGVESRHEKTRAVCEYLVEHSESVWNFARVEGVEVTNNRAERALRGAVLWRRSSTGTRTDDGELFVGRMLTVCQTLTLQGRDIWQWLTQALYAHRHGLTPPSLLPSTP